MIAFRSRCFVMVILGVGVLAPCASAAPPGGALLAKWCEAKPGDTREQLLARLGKPVTTLDTQLVWEAPQVHFVAFLDARGAAKQLDINTSKLTPAEVESLPCRPTRTLKSMLRDAALAAKKPNTTTPACQLVSAAEMSAILGTAVVGTSDDRPGISTQCTYRPAGKPSPSVEFKLTWGDGAVAMRGVRRAEKREPGLASPYDDIGDQAAVAGPLLLIRTGDDLVSLVFDGITGTPEKARRIFETAKARM